MLHSTHFSWKLCDGSSEVRLIFVAKGFRVFIFRRPQEPVGYHFSDLFPSF